MIKCGRGKTNPQKIQQKTATNILWYGECLCLLHCKHLYSCGGITQTIGIPSKNKEDLTMKQMSDISEKLMIGQSDEIYGLNTINWEHSSWKYLSLVMNKSSVSWTQTSTYSQILYCSWKDEREPTIKLCMGRQIDVVQKFIRIQNFGQNLMVSQWNSSGIFSQDSPHCSSATKSKSYCQDWV